MNLPNSKEICQWITETVRHAWHIEYYLQELQVGLTDKQRPHDIVGVGNKLEWHAIKGFGLQYQGYKLPTKELREAHFEKYTLPALKFHRQQDHHLAWNQYYPNASIDAMRLGAVDSCCSLLEPREYQGGHHSFDQVKEVALRNPIHKAPWMLLMVEEMRRIPPPILSDITMSNIPKKGITAETHDIISERIQETILMLRKDQKIKLRKDDCI